MKYFVTIVSYIFVLLLCILLASIILEPTKKNETMETTVEQEKNI